MAGLAANPLTVPGRQFGEIEGQRSSGLKRFLELHLPEMHAGLPRLAQGISVAARIVALGAVQEQRFGNLLIAKGRSVTVSGFQPFVVFLVALTAKTCPEGNRDVFFLSAALHMRPAGPVTVLTTRGRHFRIWL